MSSAKYSKEELLKNVLGDNISQDPDNTQKSRQFYFDYWHNILSENKVDYNGSVYRGETIISFNTIAGVILRLSDCKREMPSEQSERLMAILDPSSSVPESIQIKMCRFYSEYHTLANFMPLPNLIWDSGYNLNQEKGRANKKYHDFPDIFFNDVKNYKFSALTQNEKIPKYFNLDDSENQDNNNYFKKFIVENKNKKIDYDKSWQKYIESNYLQDFFTDNNYENFVKLSHELPFDGKSNYIKKIKHHKIDDETKKYRDDCYVEIEKMLDNSHQIIKKRAQRLSEQSSTFMS